MVTLLPAKPARRREARNEARAQYRCRVVVQLHHDRRRRRGAQSPGKAVPPTIAPTTLPPARKSAAPKPATKDEPDPWAGRTDLFVPPNLHADDQGERRPAVALDDVQRAAGASRCRGHTVPSVDVTLARAHARDTPSRSTRPGWRSSSRRCCARARRSARADQISEADRLRRRQPGRAGGRAAASTSSLPRALARSVAVPRSPERRGDERDLPRGGDGRGAR